MKKILLVLVLTLTFFNAQAVEQYLELGTSVPIFTTNQNWESKGIIAIADSKNVGTIIAFDIEARYIWDNDFALMVGFDIGYEKSKLNDSSTTLDLSGVGFETQFGLGGRIVNTDRISLVLSGVISLGENFTNGTYDYKGTNINMKFSDLRFSLGPSLWANFRFTNRIGFYISATPLIVLFGNTTLTGSYSGNSVSLSGKPHVGDFVFIPKIGISIKFD